MAFLAPRFIRVASRAGSDLCRGDVGIHCSECRMSLILLIRNFSQTRGRNGQTRDPVKPEEAATGGSLPSIFHKVRSSFHTTYSLEDDSTNWAAAKGFFQRCQQSDDQDAMSRQCIHFLRPDIHRLGTYGKKSVFVLDSSRSLKILGGCGELNRPVPKVPLPTVMQGFYGKILDPYPFAAEKLAAHMNPLGQIGDVDVVLPFAAIEWKSDNNKESLGMENPNIRAAMPHNLYHLFRMSKQQENRALDSIVEKLVVLSSVITPSRAALLCHWIDPKQSEEKRINQRQVNQEIWNFSEDCQEASRLMIRASDWLHNHLKPLVHAALHKIESSSRRQSELGAGAASLATRRVVSADGYIH